MKELSYTDANSSLRRTDWAAVWAGVFTFAAIWTTFELLGVAIFSSPGATQPATGLNVGLIIWTIVLSIIAMYVAGRQTGHLALLADRGVAVIHGMIMFGLSLVALLVLAALACGAGVNNLSAYLANLSPAARWTGFLSLLLGWLAAMGGAASTPVYKAQVAVDNLRDIRPAA
ncbi:MAG: hypothetical protein JOZ14_12215 [Acidobacteria bacterium]|nr:hypothetical protein [Acidobacteriota bacterium]